MRDLGVILELVFCLSFAVAITLLMRPPAMAGTCMACFLIGWGIGGRVWRS